MGTFYRPLVFEEPGRPEAKYRWIDVLFIGVALFVVFWTVDQEGPDGWCLAGLILSFGIPDVLCRKFQNEQNPQKSIGSIISASKPLAVCCWIVALGGLVTAILGGLGVAPFSEILGIVPIPITFVFQRIPLWLISLVLIVFLPVFRVASFIEKRTWLRWVWAFAASAIALVILYFQHRLA